MRRRDAMKRVAMLMGGALSIPTLMVFQQGCSPDPSPSPGTFSDEHISTLNRIGDIILPPTDSPGAAEADTGGFSARMLENCYPEQTRNDVLEFLKMINPDFNKKSGDDQVSLIGDIDEIIYGEASDEEKEKYGAYRVIKELTLFGYFTSEVGATQALEYVDIPGRYEGCVPLKPGQKAWG